MDADPRRLHDMQCRSPEQGTNFCALLLERHVVLEEGTGGRAGECLGVSSEAVLKLTLQIYGSFELLSPDDERIFAYYRGDSSILVVLNFSTDVVEYRQPRALATATMIHSTDQDATRIIRGAIEIQPFSGAIWAM